MTNPTDDVVECGKKLAKTVDLEPKIKPQEVIDYLIEAVNLAWQYHGDYALCHVRANFLGWVLQENDRLRQRLSELGWCEDMEKAPRTWTPIELWSKRDGFAYTSWVGEPHNHWRDHFGARFTHWRLPIPPTSTGD